MESKSWARLRKHGPATIFDWHATEEEAREAIEQSAEKNGDQIYKFQTVAYFPDEDDWDHAEHIRALQRAHDQGLL
jgi:hypothetical protein